MNEYLKTINNALEKSYIIVLFCNCEVKYSGRAESFLAEGDRMVIIKGDKTVLVHQPSGRNPINWMPEKSMISAEEHEGTMVITSTNMKNHETMQVVVYNVYEISSAPLVDTEQLRLAGTEADMARMIYENPGIISESFVPFSMEEQTEYGFVDVFGHDNDGGLIAVECKRYTAGLSSVQQLRRYVEKIMKSKGTKKVKGYIAAPNITSNALKMLNDWGYEYVSIEPPKYLEDYKKSQKKINEFWKK